METNVYIASRKEPGGVYHYTLSDCGALTLQKVYPAACPAYLCAEGHSLYALLREPFFMQSGVAQYHIHDDGSLSPVGTISPVHGPISAHLTVFNGAIYVANYLASSVVRLPDRCALYDGHGLVATRQECPHPHCIALSPSEDLLCVADLGADCIRLHDTELNSKGRVDLPAGCGPRHLVFSHNGKFLYCVTELASTVEVLQRTENGFMHLTSHSTLPKDFDGQNAGSAIRLSGDGKFLYTSNRGHDSICVFSVDTGSGSLTRIASVPCAGCSPRDFTIHNNFLLCGNELSDEVAVFSISNDGIPKDIGYRAGVPMPWSIICL